MSRPSSMRSHGRRPPAPSSQPMLLSGLLSKNWVSTSDPTTSRDPMSNKSAAAGSQWKAHNRPTARRQLATICETKSTGHVDQQLYGTGCQAQRQCK